MDLKAQLIRAWCSDRRFAMKGKRKSIIECWNDTVIEILGYGLWIRGVASWFFFLSKIAQFWLKIWSCWGIIFFFKRKGFSSILFVFMSYLIFTKVNKFAQADMFLLLALSNFMTERGSRQRDANVIKEALEVEANDWCHEEGNFVLFRCVFLHLMTETDHAIQIQKLNIVSVFGELYGSQKFKMAKALLDPYQIKTTWIASPHRKLLLFVDNWNGCMCIANSFKFHPYWTISTHTHTCTHTHDINAFREAKWCRNHRKILF